MRQLVLLLVLLVVSTQAAVAQAYRVDLELTPAAPFPFLSKFGTIDVQVYPGGVRTEALLIHAFSRNGDKSVTLEYPLSRIYYDIPVSSVRPTLLQLARAKNEIMPGMKEFPVEYVGSGTVRGVAAKCYRIRLGPEAHINVWTTSAVPRNPQFELLLAESLRAVSRTTPALLGKVPGLPIYVELNTTRFKKFTVLRLKQIVRSGTGEENAFKTKFMIRAQFVEDLLK